MKIRPEPLVVCGKCKLKPKIPGDESSACCKKGWKVEEVNVCYSGYYNLGMVEESMSLPQEKCVITDCFMISFNCKEKIPITDYKIRRDLRTSTLDALFVPNYEG